jgi:Papain fold toxin 1, glutamine deamidase
MRETRAHLEPEAARSGSRSFSALADRCRRLQAQLAGANRAVHGGPHPWTGAAARSSGVRAAHLAAALDRAAGAAADTAAILSVFATVIQDAAVARGSADHLARSIGCRLAPDGSVEGVTTGATDTLVLARAVSLARHADDEVRVAAGIAAAGFADVAARASTACALVERRGAFSRALEQKLRGPISPWDDVRQGIAHGLKSMLAGNLEAIALGSPQYWLLRPGQAWRQARRAAEGALLAVRHPGEAVRASLGTDDLENGHAWRFWAQFIPQVAATAVTRGAATFARGATAGETASVAVEEASLAAEAPLRHTLADINPGYPRFGRDRNCAHCAVATDATLAGRPAVALPGGATRVGTLEETFGRRFVRMASRGTIEEAMRGFGHGARGIVFASRGPGRPGHLFNVVNQEGAISFVDGQRASLASFDGEGYLTFYLLRTD